MASLYLIIKYSFSDEFIVGLKTYVSGEYDLDGYIKPEQKALDVKEYEIDIDLDHGNKSITGDVSIIGVIDSISVNQIIFNFHDNMEISNLLVNGKNVSYKLDGRHLSINKSLSKNDSVKVEISYFGEPKKLGFSSFNFGSYKNKPIIYSLNEPIYASTWLPCDDDPSDKAQMEIRITNDNNFTSVSNGRLININEFKDKKSYFWKTFYPISTYLISIYSAEYKYFNDEFIENNDTLSLDYFVFEDDFEAAKRDFQIHNDAIKIFNQIFGQYPFIKEKYGVAEFLWQAGAMEHQTITGIGTDFVTGMNMFKDLLVHELAHQWWGNAVGPKTWKDIWLNEGFATYSEALFYEHYSGKDAYLSTMMAKFDKSVYGRLYDPDFLFSNTVYHRGAWVLHMLRMQLGDDVFMKLIRNYFEKYKYKTASTAQFQQLCENISGKELNVFFDQWVYNGDVPHLEYEYDLVKNEDQFEVVVDVKQTQEFNFQLPIEIRFFLEEEFIDKEVFLKSENETFKFKFESKISNILLDPNGKLLCKIKLKTLNN